MSMQNELLVFYIVLLSVVVAIVLILGILGIVSAFSNRKHQQKGNEMKISRWFTFLFISIFCVFFFFDKAYFLLSTLFGFYGLIKFLFPSSTNPNTYTPNLTADSNNVIDDTAKVFFMSRDEVEFRIIQEAARNLNLIVYPKVRTLELVTPRTFISNYEAIYQNLAAHYVDFVICNKRNHVEAVVLLSKEGTKAETHDSSNRYAEIALGVHGYKIIRTTAVKSDILDCLK